MPRGFWAAAVVAVVSCGLPVLAFEFGADTGGTGWFALGLGFLLIGFFASIHSCLRVLERATGRGVYEVLTFAMLALVLVVLPILLLLGFLGRLG